MGHYGLRYYTGNAITNNFSALRPESANFLAAVRNEVAAFRHHRAEK